MSSGARQTERASLGDPPSLTLGYLAALPLFLAYELALALGPDALARASAEAVVARGLTLLGPRLQGVRLALLLVLALLALLRERRESERCRRPLAPALALCVALGALAGLGLAPLLAALHGWLGADLLEPAPEHARGLLATLRLLGAAPWEELLFRVGLYGGLYLLARRTSVFLGLHSRLAQGMAELVALLLSALLFALFHLDAVQGLLGSQGEPYHRGLFLWRISAGLVLGGLFRWQGFGVAAWAHAVFNLGVALGL